MKQQIQFKTTARVNAACGIITQAPEYLNFQTDIPLSWHLPLTTMLSPCVLFYTVRLLKVIQLSNNNWFNIVFVFNEVSFANRQWVEHFWQHSREKQFQSLTINDSADGAAVQCSLTGFCLLWLNVCRA